MSSLLFALALIVSYAFIGAGIKLLDQAADYPDQFQSRQAHFWLVTIGLAIIVNIWVFYDVYTAVLAIGIIMGLITTRKVDNNYFIVLAVAILPLSIFRLAGLDVFLSVLPTLIVVFLASILDELLHSKAPKIQNTAFRWILAHRPILKIAVLILLLFGFLTLVNTIAFWCFDVAYDLVTYYFGASSSQKT